MFCLGRSGKFQGQIASFSRRLKSHWLGRSADQSTCEQLIRSSRLLLLYRLASFWTSLGQCKWGSHSKSLGHEAHWYALLLAHLQDESCTMCSFLSWWPSPGYDGGMWLRKLFQCTIPIPFLNHHWLFWGNQWYWLYSRLSPLLHWLCRVWSWWHFWTCSPQLSHP